MVYYGTLWYIIVDYRILRYILVCYRLLWYIIHGSLTDHAGLVELVGIVGRCTKAKRPPRKGRGRGFVDSRIRGGLEQLTDKKRVLMYDPQRSYLLQDPMSKGSCS